MEIHKTSEITVHELKILRDINKKIQILDVRENSERRHVSIKGTINIKISELSLRYEELDSKKNVFVLCHKGIRSKIVVKWLKSKGYDYAVNILGGIDAWSALIDTSLRRY